MITSDVHSNDVPNDNGFALDDSSESDPDYFPIGGFDTLEGEEDVSDEDGSDDGDDIPYPYDSYDDDEDDLEDDIHSIENFELNESVSR